MIKTVYNAVDVWVLNDEPDWVDGVSASVSVVAGSETGLTNRETRFALGRTLRFQTSFNVTLEGAEARRLAGGLRDLMTEPVLMPLWPAAVRWADRGDAAIRGGLSIVYKEDWSNFALFEGVEPGWALADDLIAPVIWGRLDKRDVEWLSPEVVRFHVKHIDAGPGTYAIVPSGPGGVTPTFAAGPMPSGAWAVAPRIYPFEINFTSVKDGFSLAVLREQLGFGREPMETLYPQVVAREPEGEHGFESAQAIGAALEFFLEHGAGKAFWAPDWVNAAVLEMDVVAGDAVLPVTDTEGIEDGDWLGLLGNDGAVTGVRVLSHTADTITLVDVLAEDLSAETMVVRLLLCRLSKTVMGLQWPCNDYAQARLGLRELPAEYAPAADETLGTTVGLLAGRIYLYEFSRRLAGAVYTGRYTSFETELSYGGNDYLASGGKNKVSHGEIKQGISLDNDEVEVSGDVNGVSELLAMAKMGMEARLFVKILQGEVAGDLTVSNVAVLFTGEVVRVSVTGSKVSGKCVTAGSVFDRLIPGFLFQPMCNYLLFTPGCALAKADWKCTATVQDAGAVGYPFEFVLEGLTGVGARAIAAIAAGLGADWFSLGWMEMGAGLLWQMRPVLLSAAPVAGVLTVTLDRDPAPYPVNGDAVVLYPGCDQQGQTCRVKFDNWLNFGGHEFMPLGNPSAVRTNQTGAGGKK